MVVLYIVSQEQLLTKVNHKYPTVGKMKERTESCLELV